MAIIFFEWKISTIKCVTDYFLSEIVWGGKWVMGYPVFARCTGTF